MGLFNALADAVKGAAEAISNAFSGGSSDSSSSSSDSEINYDELDRNDSYDPYTSYNSGSTNESSNSTATIGKSYDGGGTVSTSSGNNDWSSPSVDTSSYNTDFTVNNGVHADIDRSATYDYNPNARLFSYNDAYAKANDNYNSAKIAYDDYVAANAGNVTDELSNYYYQQGLAPLQQNLAKAENNKNMFNPLYTPNYKTSAELNGTSAEDARAAAQRAADIANERGQSRTNYLKTYMTEDSNWTSSKYLDENGNRLNSNPLITYDSNDQIPEIPEPKRSAEDEYNRKQQEYMMMNHDNSAYHQAQKDRDATQNIGEWLKNTIGAGATEWVSGMIGKAGTAQGAAAEGTEKQYIDMMNEEWQALLKAGYAQAMDDDPRDKESNQNVVDDHLRKLKGYADAIGDGTFEQVYSNYEKALKAVLDGEVDIEYALANMNDGKLPDLSTWKQASDATMGLATEVQQQSAEMMQNAKFAAGNTKVGDIATEVLVNNATQIADRLVTGILTGGLGIAADAAQKAISLGLLYLRSSGSKATEAFNAGADNAQQNLAGDMSGAVEVLTEVLGDYVGNLYGKGIAADAAEETIRRVAKSDIGRTGLRILNAFKGEFKEEFVSAIVEPAINAVYDAEAANAYKTSEGRTKLLEDALYEGMLGGFGGILGLGESSITSNANINANERLNDIDAIQQNLEDNGMSTKEARAAAPAIHDYQQGEELSGKEKKAINNPIIQSLYGIDKSQIDAVEAAIKRGEITREDVKAMPGASPDIIKEANKPRDNDKIDADIAAFNSHAQELATASVGDVVLDAENNPVATVTEVNDHGITVEFEDGHKNSAVFVGNNGLLDAESDLAKALGENGEGAIVNAEEAKIFAQEAAARRKAQEAAKAAAAKTPQMETDSGTGTVATAEQPQQPTKKAPTPGKPASMESTDSGTGTSVTQQQTQQLEEQPVQKAPSPIKPTSNETTDSGTGTVAASQTTNPLVQEERSTTDEERAEQQAPEAPKSKAQQFFDENPQKGRVYTSDYKGATVKIKNNGDGTYTVSMASPLKNGTGFTKAAKTIGTVSSIDEANQIIVDEYNRRNPAQKAFGETLGITSQNAPESPVSASPQTGKTVPESDQEQPQASNEKLNTGSDVDFRRKEDLGESSKTQKRETVPAETLEKALYGAADVGAARYEGTLNAKQVAKLSATQVIQRLQNYARKAGTSIKGLLKRITTDETGEPLVSNQSHTKQLIDSAISGTIGQNVNGEFEDEVDVVGGEDDTRKERKKQSVEEAQEEANEIIRSNLELIGDSIRDATKADRSKYPAGLDGICDWILDSGRKRGIMPTKAEYDAFRQLVKNLLNDEFHRQNHWAKDKNGNVKGINWKKFTAVDALKLIDNMLADKANLENLSDADFTEINALLERAGNIDVGYGEYRKALGDTYIGRVSLADILAGDERFEEKLPNSEIYGNTNLTAGEKWVKDKNGNEVKVSDEEGWKENPKEETTDNALDGMTELEREEYEDAYWVKNGARDVANMFAQKSNTGTGNGIVEEILPDRINRRYNPQTHQWEDILDENGNPTSIPNPRLSGTVDSRRTIQSYNSKSGKNFIIQVGNGMFRHFLDTGMSPKIKAIIDQHKQNVKTLQKRIENGILQRSQLSPALGDRIKKWDAKIAKLENQLALEEAWLEKVENGWDKDGSGKIASYTLTDFLNDKTKDANGKDFITKAEKDSIRELATFYIDKYGVTVANYGGYKLKGLANAKSRDFARDVIDEIVKGVENGELTEHGYFGSRETDNLANRSGVTISESGNYTNSGYYGEQSPADARAEQKQREEQELQNQSGYSGVGNVVDDYGTVRQVSGTTGSRQGRRPLKGTQISRAAQEATTSINDFSEPAKLTIRPKGSKPGATISAKWLGGNIYLDGEATGEINPESYRDNNNPDSERLVRVAGAIRDAAAEAGLAIVQINGQIYSTHTDENGEQFTNRTSAIAELSEGYIAISKITDESAGELILDTIHEIMHEHTTNQFGMDSGALLDFIDELSNKSGVNIKAKAQKVIAAYSEDGVTFDASCADEMISRIAEGHDCNGNFTAKEVEKLQDALFSSTMLEIVADDAPATVALLNYSRTQARNKAMPANLLVNKPATDVGYTPSTAEQEERISGIVRGEDVFSTKESKQSIDLYNFKAGLGGNQTERANPERLNRPTEQEALATKKNPLLRKKEDLDAWTDETFDSLIAEENARAAAALGEGNPIDQSDMDTLVNEASADEEALLNSRGGNVSAEDTGRFNNLVDQASASERETLNDLRNDSEDITNASEGSFDNLVDTENESIENALNEAAESSANQYPERRFKDAKDYYGSAYDKVVKPVAERHARANSRSSFTHEDIYNKLYDNTPNAKQNFRRLQKLNTNIDSLLKGKMSAQAFNAFIKNMMDEQGIGQIVNDDIQKEFSELAKLEEKATNGDQHDSDVINFQYAAADAVAHLCARMDMVEKTERARAKLDSLAKEHGKTNKKALGNAVDWWNRMQISGDNFWRMAGNWDAASRNQGYAFAQEHNKCIATRISEEAKLKDYFSGIDKNSKQFRDFANGTTMSNVDFEGHKISLMEAVKFVKICDTMRAFANENRRPDWQRVAALGGFAFEGKDGKPVFVDIQGSKKNGGAERVQWVQDHYDAAMAEIKANKAASEYMKACEEMYWDASQTAEKVHSKVNGYERYMYGKGKYTDIHYASKDGTVDFSYKDRDAIDVHDTGIMQKRTRVNGGYVICNPMSRSIDAYISQISNYIAFEEFGQKLGVLNDSKSINGNYANTVGDAYGSNYSQWFDNYVKTMTLYRETNPKKLKDKALQKARQAMITGALSLSVSVPIKQVSSFFDTMGMLDPRAVNRVFRSNPSGKKVKGINNYLYQSRGQSISDPDLAELFGDKGMLGKFKNTKVGKVVMSATNMMDEKAVSNVYLACVYDTELNTLSADKLYKNGKNFKDGLTAEGQFYVDSKFEQVLLGTQPIFTPQARNELARTDNQFLRMFQTFRTQQTQNYNRALQSISEWKAASKNGGDTGAAFKKVRQTVQGQLTASVSLAALNAIATTLLHKHHKYKDDDDEFDKEKFWKRFGLDALESFLGNALWLGDLTKWAIDKADISDSREFYGVASGALGTAWTIGTSAVDLYRNIQEDGWTQSNKVSARYLAGNVATALGKPLNNAYAILNAGWQWYADFAHIDRKYDDIFLQWAYVTDTPQNRLANAILKGDNDQIADLIDEIGEDKLTNTVSYGALDKYKQGKIDEAEYVEILMDFANMSYKDASKEVQKKKALIDSGISQYNGIDGRDGRAAFYDQYSDNFKSRQAYKDFFSDVKAGKADGKHNTYYTTYYGKQQEVTANQSSIIDRMNENIKAGNFDYNTAKLLWEDYYGYSSSKWSAWQYVGK